jgi:isopenicillin N synthase-like dioxygenase
MVSVSVIPELCSDTIVTAAKNMLQLQRTVEAMILEGLGVQEVHISAHLDTLAHAIFMSRYGVSPSPSPDADTTSVSLHEHRDYSVITTIVQHEVEGLEVELMDRSWVVVPPQPDSFVVVAGEMFTVKSPFSHIDCRLCALCAHMLF